jgi:hypothetical protein
MVFLINGKYFNEYIFKSHLIVTAFGLVIFFISTILEFCEVNKSLSFIKFACSASACLILILNVGLIDNLLLILILFEPIKFCFCDVFGHRPIGNSLKKILRVIKIFALFLTTFYLYFKAKNMKAPKFFNCPEGLSRDEMEKHIRNKYKTI